MKPDISLRNKNSVKATHHRLGDYYLYFQTPKEKWFTENVTNTEKVMGIPNKSPFVKDAFHSALIKGENLDASEEEKKRNKIFSCIQNQAGRRQNGKYLPATFQ